MSIFVVLPLVQAAFCLVLMFIILRGHYRSSTHRVFSLFLLCLATWGFILFGMRGSPDVESAYLWERWLIPLGPFMAVLFYHFSVLHTSTKYRRRLLGFLYLICILFVPTLMTRVFITGMQIKSYGYAPVYTPLNIIWMAFAIVLGIMAINNFVRTYRMSQNAEERNQAAYIIIGIALVLLGGLFDVLPLLGLPAYPGLVFGVISFCLLATVAILKHNLLDISIVLRKGVAYILTSALIAAPITGIAYLFTNVLYRSDRVPWPYVPFIIVFLLALILPLVWRLAQQQVDKWFYRDRYDYLKALETFNWHSESLSDFAQVGDTTVKMIAGALRASDVYLLQPVTRSRDFQVVGSTNDNIDLSHVRIGAQSPLIKWLQESSGILLRQDIQIIPQLSSIIWEERELLERIGAELIFSLRSHTVQISGLLVIGKKITGNPYRIEEMQLISALSNQIAVTFENIRLYKDILESRENLETWLNSMNDCVMIINADQTVQFMNHAAEVSFGSHNGKKCWEILGFNKECSDCLITGMVNDHETSQRYIENRNIREREYEVVAAPLLNPDGTKSIIQVFRDITERKRLEEEIIQAKVRIETLHQSERLKTDLLSMVSHELRTPLSIIKGYITTLLGQKKWSEEEKRDFLVDIDQETDYLTRLVANLLDMSRLEAGALELEKDWYQISEILEWVDGTLRMSTKYHDLRILIQSDLPLVFVDRVRIGQVLVNLCENAAKYSEKGSEITIEAELSGESVVLSVRDEGNGIALENLEKVFDRFYRIGNNNYSESGIGLGLSICRGIIETHGGRIWVQSEVGIGSKFSFELPINEKEGSAMKLG